jgi:hypothetical protein
VPGPEDRINELVVEATMLKKRMGWAYSNKFRRYPSRSNNSPANHIWSVFCNCHVDDRIAKKGKKQISLINNSLCESHFAAEAKQRFAKSPFGKINVSRVAWIRFP